MEDEKRLKGSLEAVSVWSAFFLKNLFLMGL